MFDTYKSRVSKFTSRSIRLTELLTLKTELAKLDSYTAMCKKSWKFPNQDTFRVGYTNNKPTNDASRSASVHNHRHINSTYISILHASNYLTPRGPTTMGKFNYRLKSNSNHFNCINELQDCNNGVCPFPPVVDIESN